MAKKISQLTQATEVKSDDVTVIVQDGETKKLPLNMMVTKQDVENKKIAGLAKLDEIEATYENDTYTPTITVKNKSSVKTGEGDEVDYSANVMDGHVKSAILKGQTLVNLANFNFVDTRLQSLNITQTLKMNATYTIILDVETIDYTSILFAEITYLDNTVDAGYRLFENIKNGINKTRFIPSKEIKELIVKISGIDYNDGKRVSVKKAVILDGDYTNIDIPFFDGMQSVKLPVLTTVGKNTWNTNEMNVKFDSGLKDIQYFNNSIRMTNDYQDWRGFSFKNKQSLTYLSFDVSVSKVNDTTKYIRVVSDGVQLGRYDLTNGRIKVQLPQNSEEIKIQVLSENGVDVDFEFTNIQLEKDSFTSYEPYKTNILTVNEDVELGSVGEVKDELNLLTGQLTQRTETRAYQEGDESNSEVLTDMTNTRYKLPKEVIKTVDLIPSGTHPSTTPYCWKDGHIQLSSSGLLPSLEYSVVTSRAGQISQNAAMIVKNDKRIFDLEILLAGGLVNTTYQALTLQNQVETGLSKVSLSSETEPDYLLYHMIMKLIEEKAYKLDDLTEKVSVFYLYEKLSDEQFETIYSALYPFVEDEIVEEPIVDEVLEEVENGVVM